MEVVGLWHPLNLLFSRHHRGNASSANLGVDRRCSKIPAQDFREDLSHRPL